VVSCQFSVKKEKEPLGCVLVKERKGIYTEGTESTEDTEKRRKAAARLPQSKAPAGSQRYKI
jgi:hypothetical protein